jgi:ABC-type xylose transport system permease subunit
MAQENEQRLSRRFWFWLIALVILLIFLYFYAPFEAYLVENIPGIRFSNVLFWFASLVAVIAFVVSHWQSFRQNIIKSVTELDVSGLVFDTLQISILVAIILCAGATLQAVEMLAEGLIARQAPDGGTFGRTFVSIVLLVILTVLFYLLHHLVRAFRYGWKSSRQPPRQS